MQFDNWLDIDTNPLYALLHEAIYCQVKVYFSDFFLYFSPFFSFLFFFVGVGRSNLKFMKIYSLTDLQYVLGMSLLGFFIFV